MGLVQAKGAAAFGLICKYANPLARSAALLALLTLNVTVEFEAGKSVAVVVLYPVPLFVTTTPRTELGITVWSKLVTAPVTEFTLVTTINRLKPVPFPPVWVSRSCKTSPMV